MDKQLLQEFERLTANTAMRREDLLNSGLIRSSRKKQLTILSGILALTSAATIAAIITKLYGADGMLIVSALVAFLSGSMSLIAAVHYSDDEIYGRLGGASKYLALRDSVFRIAIDPETTDQQKRASISALHAEYTNLDTIYSKYFTKISKRNAKSSLPPGFVFRGEKAMAVAQDDIEQLRQRLDIPEMSDFTSMEKQGQNPV